MEGKITGKIITTDFKANQSHVFRFFKENTDTKYDVKIDNDDKGVTVIEKAK